MKANWYLVKYVRDAFRNEPVNIGVIITLDQHGVARFIGQRADGQIDGRRARSAVASPDTLRAWANYIRHHLAEGTFEEKLASLSARSLDNYRIERRGALLEPLTSERLPQMAEDLFRELVREEPEKPAPTLDDLTNQLLYQKLQFPPDHKIEENVRYVIDLRGARREFSFDYRYVNGRASLLEKISLADREKSVETRVNDLLFRMEHIAESPDAGVTNFISLFDVGSNGSTAQVEHHLRAIEKFSHTINVRSAKAADEVGDCLGVPVLR
ncbi:hypothetical protein ABZ780_17470 [Micromonospora sp. NPDC047467]|uniref:hypothetical protein n=1 Tax=Micromonospora sp. NPDC047467 TaxID=3154814 RepID=UPI00340AB316